MECEAQFENDQVCCMRVKIMPGEEIGLHRDDYPAIVVALKGGIITRLEANGMQTNVTFPTGIAVFRPEDPYIELHRSVNKGSEAVELVVIQLKAAKPLESQK